jgi:outer membrane protein assembly factor BamA
MTKHIHRYLLTTIVVTLSSMPIISLAAIEDRVFEQRDNAIEIKAFATKPKGNWLPVPIPVSNPTIGSGLQAALLYLHPKKSEDPDVPNATSGIMAMYTNTESWLAGGFHDGNWKDDLYRYRFLIGTGEFNLDYFGVGNDSVLADNPIEYNIISDILLTQLLRRLPGSENWYMGTRYMFIDSNVEFEVGNLFPGLPPITADMTTSGLGLMVTFDSRNDNYYPTEGINFEFVWMRDSETWGSDFDFDKVDTRYNTYFSLTSNDTLALRVAFSRADDDIPFYLLPSLKMRGFPNGRYKDENSLSGHAEWRRKFHPRWGSIISFEVGSTAASAGDLFQDEKITSYGAGIRWQVTKDKGLNLGVDVGYSDNESAVYVQVGERF